MALKTISWHVYISKKAICTISVTFLNGMKFYRLSVKIIDVIHICICKERKLSKKKTFILSIVTETNS